MLPRGSGPCCPTHALPNPLQDNAMLCNKNRPVDLIDLTFLDPDASHAAFHLILPTRSVLHLFPSSNILPAVRC